MKTCRWSKVVALLVAAAATLTPFSAAPASAGPDADEPSLQGAALDIGTLEQAWAARRVDIVERISSNGWGLQPDGRTIAGPNGFRIDVSQCPAGWNNLEGVTATSILVGHTTATSGPLADYANIARAMQKYFDYVAARGGIVDSTGPSRSINLIVKDDGYDAARTAPLVNELVESDRVFAAWTLGSPNSLRVNDYLNGRCVPQGLSFSGHPGLADPRYHPWTTGFQLSYAAEARLWVRFLEAHVAELPAGPIRVGAVVMRNDFGYSYADSFRAALATSPLNARVQLTFVEAEPTAVDINGPMAAIRAASPHLFIAMTAGTACTQAITSAQANGLRGTARWLFMPAVCLSSSFVGRDRVGGDGSASNGWAAMATPWVPLDPEFAANPFVAFSRGLLTDGGLNPDASGSFGAGMYYGWTFVEALRIASALPGGLSRANFIVALRVLDLEHPLAWPGVRTTTNGGTDAHVVEGAGLAVYDSVNQRWRSLTEVYDASGQNPNCAWNRATGRCEAAEIPTPPRPFVNRLVGDVPLMGDWDGNRTSTLGVYRSSTSTFYLRNANSSGGVDIAAAWGGAGDVPIAGDWDGNGTTTFGVYRPSNGTFYLRNSNSSGGVDLVVPWGPAGSVPIVGDWDGNGTTTIGVRVGSTFYFRNTNAPGGVDGAADWGLPTDVPVMGDWDDNGTTTLGVWRDGLFFLRNSNVPGGVDATVALGDQLDIPLAGRWSGGQATVGVRRGSNFLLAGTSQPRPPLAYAASWGQSAVAR